MKKYRHGDEQNVRTERFIHEWLRSGLIDQTQHDRMLPDVQPEFRRTNLFLRLVLFGFGLVIVGASTVLVADTLRLRSDTAGAALCLVAAVASFALAEYLITHFRLYRFGVEEAAVCSSAVLLVISAGFVRSILHLAIPTEFVIAVVGSAVALAAYLRFGYLYAAFASLLCLAAAPFQLSGPIVMQRAAAAGIMFGVFVICGRRSVSGKGFPAAEFAMLRAAAFAALYAVLNLHLSTVFYFSGLFGPPDVSDQPFAFYVLTYLTIWGLPLVGMIAALHAKQRPLLDVSLVLALVTLITNKPYLGAARQTWDPILLGLVLIATAVAVRRWLSQGSGGSRDGITSARLLSSDNRRLAMVGTMSAALQAGAGPVAPESSPKFEGGGGRSGGAGGSGSW
jgi:hypothetical protein